MDKRERGGHWTRERETLDKRERVAWCTVPGTCPLVAIALRDIAVRNVCE